MATDVRTQLKNRMETLGLNQSEAAEQCGVSRSVFSYWLSEQRAALPSMDNIAGVAKFLNLTEAELLGLYPAAYKMRASRSSVSDLSAMRAEIDDLRARVDTLTKLVKKQVRAR
jgi:transcriptional regulator with XRE-family HTH domain